MKATRSISRSLSGPASRVSGRARAAATESVDIHRHLAAIERVLGLAEKLVWPA